VSGRDGDLCYGSLLRAGTAPIGSRGAPHSPKYVKAYLNRGKNDATDAAAICESAASWALDALLTGAVLPLLDGRSTDAGQAGHILRVQPLNRDLND
jgi:hypothetical protein